MTNKGGILYVAFGMTVLLVISLIISIGSKESPTEIRVDLNDMQAYVTESESTVYSLTTEASVIVTEPPSTELPAETQNETLTEEEPFVNLNTAGAEEFQRLNGIGPALADAIISYRSINGNFNNIEEIMLVEGIGEGIFDKIRNNIYVDNPIYTEPEISLVTEEIVPTEPETATEHKRTLEEAAPININTADVEELMLLPHVTEEIALKIIELREMIQGYSHVYELLYIEELEQNEVAEIVKFVTVGQ